MGLGINSYIYSGTQIFKYILWYPKDMRLLSQKHSQYKDKEYKKFWVIIPQKIIEKLGWKEGQDLEPKVKGGILLIEKD